MLRRMASSVLCFESFIVLFFGLVAMKLTSYGAGTVWAVCGPVMVLCILLCGALRSEWGYRIGWLLQIGLIASGLVIGTMYFIGIVFALIWYYALKAGTRIDREKAEAYEAYETAHAEGSDAGSDSSSEAKSAAQS